MARKKKAEEKSKVDLVVSKSGADRLRVFQLAGNFGRELKPMKKNALGSIYKVDYEEFYLIFRSYALGSNVVISNELIYTARDSVVQVFKIAFSIDASVFEREDIRMNIQDIEIAVANAIAKGMNVLQEVGQQRVERTVEEFKEQVEKVNRGVEGYR